MIRFGISARIAIRIVFLSFVVLSAAWGTSQTVLRKLLGYDTKSYACFQLRIHVIRDLFF